MLHIRAVVYCQYGVIAVPVGSRRGIGTQSKLLVDVGVVVAVKGRSHVELHRRNVLQKNVRGIIHASARLTFPGRRVVRVPEDG